MMGTENWEAAALRAIAVEVLQAITMSLTPQVARKAQFCRV
jgi:hypothetical protein